MRVFLLILLLLSAPAYAADTKASKPAEAPASTASATPSLPDRVVRPMRAIDSMTLRAEGLLIHLWGIKPAQTRETPLELKALDLMDNLIQEQQVNCKVMGGAMPDLLARCATQENRDLALELLTAGFAVVDRQQTYDSVFATSYEKAQESARLSGRGVWGFTKEAARSANDAAWMSPRMQAFLPFALIFGPLAGLLVIAFVAWHWLKTMQETQVRDSERAQHKEAVLQARERQVLITTIEGELTENKNKIDAFIVIYGDLLRSLKDPSEKPKYQEVGDIVQKHPNYSKSVFETNIGKLSLLDIKVAGQLSKLYASMPGDTEYINLDQGVALDTAVKLVEKVLKDAESFIAPIDAALSALTSQASGH